MKTQRNEAIGTVECPVKACSERCDVFRYRERGDTEKSVANRRFAGKLYGRCKDHGRFGGDTGDQAMQEYILDNATMHSPSAGDRRPAPAKAPATPTQPAPAKPPRSPARSPATAAAAAPAVATTGFRWPWE